MGSIKNLLLKRTANLPGLQQEKQQLRHACYRGMTRLENFLSRKSIKMRSVSKGETHEG
jgi:hypothetical protein